MTTNEKYTESQWNEAIARSMLWDASISFHGKPWCDEQVEALEFAVGVYLTRARQMHEASLDREVDTVRRLMVGAR